MKQRIRLGSALLALSMVFSLIVLPVQAAEATTESAHTSNLGAYEYTYDRWANPVNSYLVAGSDGTLTRVEYSGAAVAVETYDQDLQFVSGMLIDAELPLFGGFYSGLNYNFLVFGQTNTEEDDSKEVIRVVCYTKTWERVGAASLNGANTTVPFDAGSLRFAEYGDYLYIRTAHEMYTSSDGLNHQANLTFNVRISDMTITDSAYEVSNNNWGYVSHSFNQFIAVDGTTLVAADHGDAYPRAVMLSRYYAPAGQDQFLVPTMVDLGDGSYTYRYAQTLNILSIAGTTGDNDTGVSLGGFECSDTSYLVAGNTVSQGDDYDPDGQRNIFVSATDKNNFTADGTVIRYLTSHTSGVEVSNPHFAKVTDNKYIVIWTETADTTQLCYAFVDGTGAPVDGVYTTAGVLSDCQPIVWGDKLVWYVTNASAPAFFTIDLNDPTQVTRNHLYTYEYAAYPGYTRAGALSATCMICGEAGEGVEVPAIKDSNAYTLYREDSAPTCAEEGYGYYSWNDQPKYNVTNYIFGAPIPALGHSDSYTDNGDGTHDTVCSVCGEVMVDNEAHTYTDGTCVCGAAEPVELFDIDGANMTLGNSLAMNFYILPSDLVEGETYYAVITKEYADGRDAVTVTVEQEDWLWHTGYSEWYVSFNGVAAKEMTDLITVVIYNSADEQVSNVWEDSVQAYAMRMLLKEEAKASPNAEKLTLYVDMLNYGAAAQVEFGYNTDNLANNQLTEAQAVYATSDDIVLTDNCVEGEGYSATNLTLESDITMNFFFLASAIPTEHDDYYAIATWTDHYGKAKEVRVEGEDFAQLSGDTDWYVPVKGVVVADARQLVTVTVYNAEGEAVATGTDSIESYVARNVNKKAIYLAIMKFCVSAYESFH